MTEKKIVAFIVEGTSDEAALGSIMKEHFSSNLVQFVVVHGDITSRDFVSVDNILKKINAQIDIIRNVYRYEIEDFVKIIQIVDMDGVYIPDENVKETETDAVKYFQDHIEAKDKEAVIRRNKQKGDILLKLRKTGKLQGIPYRIFFNSCNLEHVLYGELKDYSDEEKEILSDDFADQYDGKADEFIEFISGSDIAVPGAYQKTWDYIEKDVNSLNRHSNIHLLFENGR